MYLDTFGLKLMPFRVSPDPRFAFPSMSARLASGKMQFAITEQMGLALIMGPSGVGKSTLCYSLIAQFGRHPEYNLAYMPGLADRGRAAVIKRIMAALGAPASKRRNYGDVVEEFQRYLLSEADAGRHCVVLLDEASSLSSEALIVIGEAINFRSATQGFFTVCMFGLPNMPLKLRGQNMTSVRSRIAIVANLDALSPDETRDMIRYRLAVAAGVDPNTPDAAPQLFDESAFKAVYAQTKGVPRDVCVLCGTALLEAFIRGRNVVSGELVDNVVAGMAAAKKWPVSDATPSEQLDKEMTGVDA